MDRYFHDMIRHARTTGEVILYKNILEITQTEEEDVILLLAKDYEQECLSHPYTSPTFSSSAAIWAARLFYYASQALLFREHNITELRQLIKPYDGNITAETIISADLCLRFIPDLLFELELLDNTDPLIPILEEIMQTWHFSAIGYKFDETEKLDFTNIKESKCLNQLYTNRVIELKVKALSQHPALHSDIEAELSIYKNDLWSQFE